MGAGATVVIDQFWERSFQGWSRGGKGAGCIGRRQAAGRRQGRGGGGHKGQGQRLATAASAGAGARSEGREFDGLAAPRPPPPHLPAEDCHLSQRVMFSGHDAQTDAQWAICLIDSRVNTPRGEQFNNPHRDIQIGIYRSGTGLRHIRYYYRWKTLYVHYCK